MKVLKGQVEPRMPLGAPPLSDDKIAAIAAWIKSLKPTEITTSGTGWWAVRPLEKGEPPALQNSAGARNGIDQFIRKKLEENKLSNAPEAARQTLLRRAYFDLIGLPPTTSEVEAFLNDKAPDAYEKLIDRLLADPRYGERWGRHWLDLVRYADTRGYEGDLELSSAWRYRDYVIDSFNKDKPYDRFIKEQIAGDELTGGGGDDDDDDDAPRRFRPPNPEGQIALGFLRLGPKTPNVSSIESRQMTLDEITGTVGSVFLGITMKCAQCHDHKYDPIPQRDYYRLQAFFAPIEFLDQRVAFGDPALRAKMDARRADYAAKLKVAEEEFNAYQGVLMAKLTKALESQGDPKVKPDVRELTRRLVRDDAGNITASQDRTFTDEEKQRYLDLLELMDPTNPGNRQAGLYRRQVARHEPLAHSARNANANPNAPNRPITHVLINGEFDKLGEHVEPGFLSVITGNSDPAPLPMQGFGNVSKWRSVLAASFRSRDRIDQQRFWKERRPPHSSRAARLAGTAVCREGLEH